MIHTARVDKHQPKIQSNHPNRSGFAGRSHVEGLLAATCPHSNAAGCSRDHPT